MSEYVAWTPTTNIPMLYLYATPGAINAAASLDWVEANLQNVTTSFVGEGGHFFQEDYPTEIGAAIVNWLANN